VVAVVVVDTMTLLLGQVAQAVVVLVLHKPVSRQVVLLIPVVVVVAQVVVDQETASAVLADMVS
jgi:hypothetical protein